MMSKQRSKSSVMIIHIRRYVIICLLLFIVVLQLIAFLIQHGEIYKSKNTNNVERSMNLDNFILSSSAKKKINNGNLDQVNGIGAIQRVLPSLSSFKKNAKQKENNNDRSYNSNADYSTKSPPVIAYVVSLIKCPDSTHTTGFLDATLILRHSIDMNSYKHTGSTSTSKYSYKMYVIVHTQCSKFAAVFEQIGIEALIVDSPVKVNDIQNKDYRDNVDYEFCCGSAEFIKLYAYTMTQHPIVVHMDMDMILLKPLDNLFNAMLLPADSPGGRHARSRIELEFPDNDVIPDKIDAFFTKDYTSSWPWKVEAPVQAGFLVLRPSVDAFEEYKDIITVGNYTLGFNNTSGWDALGYGGWIGGKAMQGILPYFYGHRHKGTAVELNCCRHNQVAARVTWDQQQSGREHFFGKCNRFSRNNEVTNTGCEDCRNTPIPLVNSVHFTACRKPWTCAVPQTGTEFNRKKRKRFDPAVINVTICLELQKKWFGIRRNLEDQIIDTLMSSKANNANSLKDKIISTRSGSLMSENYLGYCVEEGKYNALALPNKEEFDLRLVYNNSFSANTAVAVPTDDEPLYEHQLKAKMQERLKTLSPPKWPQLNHGTSMAITNGVILGPACSSSLTTIVTAFYEFEKAKHSTSSYEIFFPRLLQVPDPMIIFVEEEPNSKWFDFVQERRQHAPTILIRRKFSDFVMSTTFSNDFWTKVHEIDHELFRHNIDLYKIWNEKLILMSAAIEINPFESTQFLWADAGYFRRANMSSRNKHVVAVNVTKNGLQPSKVMFLHILNPQQHYPIVAAGNMYIGTRDAFTKLYNRYYQTLWFLVQNRISVGSDQHVMCYACYYFKDVCHLHSTGRLKGWFDLSKELMNETKLFNDNYNSSWLGLMETIIAPPPMNTYPVLPTGAVSEYPVQS